jgi:23S rRNA pseudouridine2605 synthase
MGKRSTSKSADQVHTSAQVARHDGERLQKVLAAAGFGSRRECEELILAGRVEVDRKVVTTLGAKASLHEQEIRVDGEPLPRIKLVHFLVNKPPGIVCTNHDPSGRPRVIDLVPSHKHLFAVGRLDMSSEGLMLVTNDGELANRLTHPRYEVEKTYHVEVAGNLDNDELIKLRRGVHLAEGFAKVVGATIKKQMSKSTLLEVVLKEGRNREIRRLLARVGHKVLRLKRIAIGPLRLGDLPSGAFRPLSFEEVEKLQAAASGVKRPRTSIRHRGKRTQRAPQKRVEQAARPTGSIIGGELPAVQPSREKPRGKMAKTGRDAKFGRAKKPARGRK